MPLSSGMVGISGGSQRQGQAGKNSCPTIYFFLLFIYDVLGLNPVVGLEFWFYRFEILV